MASSQPDTIGLDVLHSPADPAVDICFVHGLRGGRVATWTSKNVCWPKDLLPADIPDARILSFGYDAKVVQFWYKALLKARNHVEEPDRRVEASTRRIAFLGTHFQGSDQARWAQVEIRMAGLVGETNKELMRELDRDSDRLAAITEGFPDWLRGREVEKATKVEIICFKEELETGSLGKVSRGLYSANDVTKE
ncbi:MAG: hypothetical protein Q9181_003191 [Wetmoreana brouardii]